MAECHDILSKLDFLGQILMIMDEISVVSFGHAMSSSLPDLEVISFSFPVAVPDCR